MIECLIYKNEPGVNSSLEQEEIEHLLFFVREGIVIQVFGKNVQNLSVPLANQTTIRYSY